MNIKIWAVLLVIILGCGSSDARIRRLSLSMQPDVFTAHQRLNFEEKALSEKWLESEIACHFDEEREGCRLLPPLLRMYVAAVPEKRKLKAYAHSIKDKLKYNEDKYDEIVFLLYLYCDDRSLIYLLDDYDFEEIRHSEMDKELNADEINKLLNSENEAVLIQTLSSLMKHPYDVLLADSIFEPVVQLSTNQSLAKDIRHEASAYLRKMGYFVEYGDDEQGEFSLGKIAVHSGLLYHTDYLSANPISKVWQYHAKNLSYKASKNRNGNTLEVISFVKHLSFARDPEAKEKLEYILTTKSYKDSSPSLKFIMADLLMFDLDVLALPIIKTAYKEGNNAIKSAIVAKYTEHFPVNENYWDRLMKKSTAAEQVMIKRSKKQWDINMKRLLKNK